MYIYLAEENDFDAIDSSIRNKLGQLDYAMCIEIDENSKLARENPENVIKNLKEKGFHLQLPSETSVEELMQKISQQSK